MNYLNYQCVILAEEGVTKDGFLNTKQETSEEMEQGAEASGIANR